MPVESLEHYRAQDSRSGFWSDDVSGVSVALFFVLFPVDDVVPDVR